MSAATSKATTRTTRRPTPAIPTSPRAAPRPGSQRSTTPSGATSSSSTSTTTRPRAARPSPSGLTISEFTDSSVYTFYGRHSDLRRARRTGAAAIEVGSAVSQRRPVRRRRRPHRFPAAAPPRREPDFVCRPSGLVADGNQVVTLDEAAGNLEIFDMDIFPLVTQRVPISTVGPSYDFGWVQIQGDVLSADVGPTDPHGGRSLQRGIQRFPGAVPLWRDPTDELAGRDHQRSEFAEDPLHQPGALVDHARVDLDQGGAGIELGAGVLGRHDRRRRR